MERPNNDYVIRPKFSCQYYRQCLNNYINQRQATNIPNCLSWTYNSYVWYVRGRRSTIQVELTFKSAQVGGQIKKKFLPGDKVSKNMQNYISSHRETDGQFMSVCVN